MNKKFAIGLGVALLAFIFGIGFNFFSNRADNKKEENKQTIESGNNNTTDYNNEKQVTKVEEIVKIEDGYKSSIIQGSTDLETLYINKIEWVKEYWWNDNFSFEDLIKSKNVAENFAQGIALYERSNPDKHLNKAKKYADKDCFVRDMIQPFSWSGAKENTKEMQIEGVESESYEFVVADDKIFCESINEGKLYYDVIVYWNWIDNRDIVVSKGFTEYVIGVEKIKNEFKVVDYYTR